MPTRIVSSGGAFQPNSCFESLLLNCSSSFNKEDCFCVLGLAPPVLLHTVGTPFGVLEVRVLLGAYTAAQAALGHSKSCGSWEPWIDPVLPNRARPPHRCHMPGLRALDGPVNVLLVWAKAGSSGSNQLQRAYFCSICFYLTPPLLDSNESTWVVRVLVG